MQENVLRDKKVQAVIVSSDELNVIIIYKDGSHKNMSLEKEITIRIDRKEDI